MPKETGIMYTTEMILAKQAGRKTMNRRTWGLKRINEKPDEWEFLWANKVPSITDLKYDPQQKEYFIFRNLKTGESIAIGCPYGKPGDLLWTKETFRFNEPEEDTGCTDDSGNAVKAYCFKADDPQDADHHKWKSAMFMPKKYARIWLEVTNVSVERLQEISESDAKKEGVGKLKATSLWRTMKEEFAILWDSLNAKRGYDWKSNPFVWVIEFKAIGKKG